MVKLLFIDLHLQIILILFVTYMDIIFRYSQRAEGVQFGGLRISSLFADDVALLASSCREFQFSLEQSTAEYVAARMMISTSISEAMVITMPMNVLHHLGSDQRGCSSQSPPRSLYHCSHRH